MNEPTVEVTFTVLGAFCNLCNAHISSEDRYALQVFVQEHRKRPHNLWFNVTAPDAPAVPFSLKIAEENIEAIKRTLEHAQ